MNEVQIHADLKAAVVSAGGIGAELRAAMYALFATYYDGASPQVFERELGEKDSVVTLWSGRALCGFSTLQTFLYFHEGQEIAVLFSGDTIIARPYWGRQEMAAAWLKEVGRVSRRYEGLPLYWLLIVKGHRTYRYMPTFGIEFVPDWRHAGGGAPALLALRDAIGRHRFGDEYDAQRGVIHFRQARTRLKPEFAGPTERELARPDVAYFLARNPGYVDGDELVCLCPLAPDNMRSFGRRLYEQGRRS